MKRLISALLVVLMLLSLVGCGQETAEEVQGISSYEELIGIADENRAPYIATNAKETLNIDQYAISDKALLTQKEIDVLRTERGIADKISLLSRHWRMWISSLERGSIRIPHTTTWAKTCSLMLVSRRLLLFWNAEKRF